MRSRKNVCKYIFKYSGQVAESVSKTCQNNTYKNAVDMRKLTVKAPNITIAKFANTADPDETAHSGTTVFALEILHLRNFVVSFFWLFMS